MSVGTVRQLTVSHMIFSKHITRYYSKHLHYRSSGFQSDPLGFSWSKILAEIINSHYDLWVIIIRKDNRQHVTYLRQAVDIIIPVFPANRKSNF